MTLNYQYIKNDKPVLVLIHGLLSSLETFIPVIPQLEKHFSLLLVDQRGHGKSPPSGSDYTAYAMAEDLKVLLETLQIKKAIFLGHSMGGRTVLAFGEKYPEMIEKMIVEDMGIHTRQERSVEKDLERMTMAKNVKVDSLHFKSKDEIFKVISPLYSYAKDLLNSKVITHADSFELKFWPEVTVLYGYQGNYSDLTQALSSSTFPVMFMIADPAVGSAMTDFCIEHIKQHVPRARMHLIPKSWHTIHKTHPNEFCQAIIDFAG